MLRPGGAFATRVLPRARYVYLETHGPSAHAASYAALNAAGLRVSNASVRGEHLLIGCSRSLPLAHCRAICPRWVARDAALHARGEGGRLRCVNDKE